MKIYAVVEEKEKPIFVTTLTERDANEMGETGIERMVRDWCDRQYPPLTYLDYA
jgi:hypothetical protein